MAKRDPEKQTNDRPKDCRRIETGKQGEEIAAAYLRKAGYVLLERNYRCLFGEIDIIARDGETLCFIEVKSRRSARYGDPQLAVTRKKQQKMTRVALHYLSSRDLCDRPARFDVVAVRLTPTGAGAVDLIRNAFDVSP